MITSAALDGQRTATALADAGGGATTRLRPFGS